jgi:hypothetical protein
MEQHSVFSGNLVWQSSVGKDSRAGVFGPCLPPGAMLSSGNMVAGGCRPKCALCHAGRIDRQNRRVPATVAVRGFCHNRYKKISPVGPENIARRRCILAYRLQRPGLGRRFPAALRFASCSLSGDFFSRGWNDFTTVQLSKTQSFVIEIRAAH